MAKWQVFQEHFAQPHLVLSPSGYDELLGGVASEGILGGAIYDALVAATAREAGATLITLDRRASRAYDALGVDYQLVV